MHPRIWADQLDAHVDVIYAASRSSSDLDCLSFNDGSDCPSTAEVPHNLPSFLKITKMNLFLDACQFF